MHVIRENVNGKVFGVDNAKRVAEYKKNRDDEDQPDVDLTIYEVVVSASSKNLSLKKVP